MSWFHVDDCLHAHAKLRSIPRRHRTAAMGCWVILGSWCAGQRNDGLIPAHMVREHGCTDQQAAALVEAGLWDVVENGGGWRFHDWGQWNATRSRLDHERETTRVRVARYRDAHRTRDEDAADARPTRDENAPDSSGNGDALTSDNADGNAVTSESVRLPPTTPTRTYTNYPPQQPDPGANALDDAVREASRRWARLVVETRAEALDWIQRLTAEHGDRAERIVIACLLDKTTRKGLGRLDAAPGYVADLARRVARESGHEEGRARGRSAKLPACEECGAAHGDQLNTRTITGDDGRVGPCPTCRTPDGRAA